MPIYFYSTREPFGEFSNFSRHGIEIDGQWWPTTEHYFQAQKFEDADYREQIRTATSAKQAAELGRSRAMPLRADWEAIKEEVMYRAVLAKFQAHPTLKELLLSTGSEEIVENAPGDYYWGCGKDGSGKNRLGHILMRVREELAQG
jgi:N-glycosidase YbiA